MGNGRRVHIIWIEIGVGHYKERETTSQLSSKSSLEIVILNGLLIKNLCFSFALWWTVSELAENVMPSPISLRRADKSVRWAEESH